MGHVARPGRRGEPAPLPYTLVDIDEPRKSPRRRVREADGLQWRIWVQKYAWILSLLTMVPGIGVIAWTVTLDAGFSVGVVALATLIPGYFFWRRSKSLP